MRTDDAELVRVSIREGGRLNTSVSLDGYLFGLLCQDRGSEQAARAFVRSHAISFMAAQQRKEGGSDTRPLPQSGLSRLVQRAVIQHLLMAAAAGKVVFSPVGITPIRQ